MKIMWSKNTKNLILMTKSDLEKHQIDSDKLYVHFGNLKKEIRVVVDEKLQENSIGLPEDLFSPLTVPATIPYEIKIDGEHLFIGPVIAFIPYSSIKSITPQMLDIQKERFTEYEKIKGLIFICATDSINIKTKTIEGYYFNPNSSGNSSQWVYGVFPYPNSVFKRKSLPKNVYEDLVDQIGDTIFNSTFDKWSFWNIISTDENTQKLLPYTEHFMGYKQLVKFLEKFQSVYLKPQSGSLGKGIVMVQKSGERLVFIDHLKRETVTTGFFQADDYLKKFHRSKYIIQQGVPTKYNEKNVDFRIYLQKDKTTKWKVQGLLGRVAKTGSIITNIRHTTQILEGQEIITKMFNLSEKEANSLIEKISFASIQVCEIFEASGKKIGDVALDLIVDQNLNVWILEMNKAYAYKSLKNSKFDYILKRVKPTPFEYAKVLAGF